MTWKRPLLRNIYIIELFFPVALPGKTPLHLVAIGGHHEVLMLLVDAHADMEVQSKSGRTALHYAVANDNVSMANYLIAVVRSFRWGGGTICIPHSSYSHSCICNKKSA